MTVSSGKTDLCCNVGHWGRRDKKQRIFDATCYWGSMHAMALATGAQKLHAPGKCRVP